MKELSDENVYVQDVGHIFFLDIAKNIKEPFEAFMTRTHPQEIDLRNCNIIDSKTSYEYAYRIECFCQINVILPFCMLPLKTCESMRCELDREVLRRRG